MRRRLAFAVLTTIIVAWNAALFAAPAAHGSGWSGLTYAAGSMICHQNAERSFHRNGVPYPVCARCLGLYTGAVLGVIGWAVVAGMKPVPRPTAARALQPHVLRPAIIWVAVPTLISVALAWIGIADGSNASRAALAFPVGAVITAVVVAVAARDLR